MNYSKFDKIDYDAESDDEATHQSNMPVKVTTTDKAGGTSAPGAPLGVDGNPLPTKMTGKTKEGRLKFEYQGRTIYEWEQSLDEVNIYLNPPPGLPSKMIDISITHTHLTIGVKDTPPFIDEDLGGPVKVDECTWTLSDGELNISLCKMNKAETWVKALSGRDGAEVDPVTKEELRKQMMLERFQEEVEIFAVVYQVYSYLRMIMSLVSDCCLFASLCCLYNYSIPDLTFPVPTSMEQSQRRVSLWVVCKDNLQMISSDTFILLL